MNFEFKKNQKYTLISSNVFTSRDEIQTLDCDPITGRIIFKRGRERKRYLVPADLSNRLIFNGHQVNLLLDSETGKCVGNCRFNFVSDDVPSLKAFLIEHCLNKTYSNFKQVLVRRSAQSGVDFPDEEPLFNEEELSQLFTSVAA